jgi:hypothetical protein
MQTEAYKASVRNALNNLIKANESIFNTMAGIAMQGDLKDWDGLKPYNESHEFDFQLFKASPDKNIHLLVQIVEKIDHSINNLISLNNITLEEE